MSDWREDYFSKKINIYQNEDLLKLLIIDFWNNKNVKVMKNKFLLKIIPLIIVMNELW